MSPYNEHFPWSSRLTSPCSYHAIVFRATQIGCGITFHTPKNRSMHFLIEERQHVNAIFNKKNLDPS